MNKVDHKFASKCSKFVRQTITAVQIPEKYAKVIWTLDLNCICSAANVILGDNSCSVLLMSCSQPFPLVGQKKKKEDMHAWQELNASVRKHYVAVAWSFHSLCTRKCHSCIMRNPNPLFECIVQHMVNGFPHSAWTIWFLLFSPVLPLLDSVLLSYYSTSQFLLGKHPASFFFNSRHSSTFPVGGRCGLKPFIFPRSVWPTCHWHARHRSGI